MQSRSDKILTRSNITACLRCRQKKQKCDQKLPQCGPCQKAKLDCVGYDAVAQRLAPRSYMHSLEERIATLELRLRSHGIVEDDIEERTANQDGTLAAANSGRLERSEQTLSQSSTEASPNIEALLSKSVQVTVESLSANLHVGSCNGFSFTRLFLSELHWEASRSQAGNGAPPSSQLIAENVSFQAPKGLETSPVTLPERNVAESLISIYFGLANFSLPALIFHEPTFRKVFDLVYDEDTEFNVSRTQSRKRGFVFCYLVFSISLLALQKRDSDSVSTSMCERYHDAALKHLDEVGLGVDIESIQVLLLLANYSYLHPSFLGTWKLVGMATRLVVELGLHQDPSPGTVNVLELDTRRRVFWVTYSMDRNLSVYLGRPLGFADSAVNVEFLSAIPDEFITEAGMTTVSSNQAPKKVLAIRFLRYRQLQSEMYTILHERQPMTWPYLPIDYNAWQVDIHQRLTQWHESIPRDAAPHYTTTINGLDLSYYAALILLFKPSPAIPSPSRSSLLTLAEAASKVIGLYRQVTSEKKLNLFWQASHNLFAAGTAILYSLRHSPEVQEQLSKYSLISDANACAAVLWAIAERFPAARGTRDAFDAILSSALKSLQDTDNFEVSNSHSSPQIDGHNRPQRSPRWQTNNLANLTNSPDTPRLYEFGVDASNVHMGNTENTENIIGERDMDVSSGNMMLDNMWSTGGLESGFDLASIYLDSSLYVDLH